MPGNTTELNLKTAVDADDNADYLTISLADSLRAVDALFNNISGHTHGGAHQGGPITVSGAQIADGSITGAKIADGSLTGADIADGSIAGGKITDGTITGVKITDGSITTAKIADGTIATIDLADGIVTTAKLAANAATQLYSASGSGDFSTTSLSYVDVPGLTITWTSVGGLWTHVTATGVVTAGAGGGVAYFAFNSNGSDGATLQYMSIAANGAVPFSFIGTHYTAAGTNTVKVRVRSSGASIGIPSSSGALSVLQVLELRR